jgi:hypothetical protein
VRTTHLALAINEPAVPELYEAKYLDKYLKWHEIRGQAAEGKRLNFGKARDRLDKKPRPVYNNSIPDR